MSVVALSLAKPKPDIGQIARAIDCLFGKDDIIELRALHTKGRARTDAGYFDGEHRDNLAGEAVRLSAAEAAVYVTLNPLNPQLLSRCKNRVQDFAKKTATDTNVTRRRWLLLDFDPQRLTDTSATDEQLAAAKACAKRCYTALKEKGWPEPTAAMSGNGYHLLYPVDLPNDDESRDLIKGVLSGVAAQFDDEMVTIDQSVFNAGRIIKMYGTIANKGDHTTDYPWRLSTLLSKPGRDKVVTPEQLREVGKPVNTSMNGASVQYSGTFDLEGFLSRLDIGFTQDIRDGKARYKLNHCPFNPEHGYGKAAILRYADGTLGFRCQLNSCRENHWQELRALVDGPRETRVKRNAPSAAVGDVTRLDTSTDTFGRGMNDTPYQRHTATELTAEPGSAGDDALLDAVRSFIGRFCAFPDAHALTTVSLWAAHAHMVASFHVTPRLALLSPEPSSGKTRVLEVLELLTPESMLTLNASPSPIFARWKNDRLRCCSMRLTPSLASAARMIQTRICALGRLGSIPSLSDPRTAGTSGTSGTNQWWRGFQRSGWPGKCSGCSG